MELDETDRRVLAALQEDGRLSMRELASRIGVSTPTASSKVKALEAMGLIRGYRAVLDPSLLGHAGHVVEIEARPARAEALAARVASLQGVEEVVETAGGRLFARFLSGGHGTTQTFLRALGAMEDVERYWFHPILGSRAGDATSAEPARRVEVACHLCGGPIEGAGVRKRWAEDGEREHWFCCRNCAATFGERLASMATRKGSPRRSQT